MAELPRILVVEDDLDLLTMIGTMLSPLGTVSSAKDGLEAFQLLQDGLRPDVVVTDLMMPRMDGLTLAQEMKKDDRWSGVPIIILTAKSTPFDVIKGINAGARSYVTKPFKAAELLEKVKRALRR